MANLLPKELDLLAVDDDPGILELLTECFVDLGLNMHTASCIAEARQKLSHHDYKVVLSDHNMPDGQGIDFLAEISGSEIRAVPILMTGQTELTIAVEAINRGKVFRFVTKPLDLKALIQTVRYAMELYDARCQRAHMTREVLERNLRLQKETEAKEKSLRLAADQIRAKEATVEQQKSHIETLYAEIQKAYLHTVASLTSAMEAKDRYTKGHSERVYYYCGLMAEVLGLAESNMQVLKLASILHDLGKIGVPDSILLKPTLLSKDEKRVMASHTQWTEDILKPLPFLRTVRQVIREHHERFDGRGYPAGSKGDEISIEGRILAVADAYDAMRSDRAYRQALSVEASIAELQNGTGTQFCPLCVGALLLALKTRGEYEGDAPLEWKDAGWEEDFLRLYPAFETIPTNSVLC